MKLNEDLFWKRVAEAIDDKGEMPEFKNSDELTIKKLTYENKRLKEKVEDLEETLEIASALGSQFMKHTFVLIELIRESDLEHAAQRELREETQIDAPVEKFEQIKTYSHMFDPRLRIVDTAFHVRVSAAQKKKAIGSDDAAEAAWFKFDDLPKMGFHHAQIVEDWLNTK